jgi:uncharacterized protein YbcI
MPDDELDPADAAAMREPGRPGGELRQQLSHAFVALYKRYLGRGPTNCRTYLEPDLVLLIMGGGYTAAEQTLFGAGEWHDVRTARQAGQDSMEIRFVDTIEQLTHRTVRAFMSANHQETELSVELFVLEHEQAGSRHSRR